MASLKFFLSILVLLVLASDTASRPIIEMFSKKYSSRSDDDSCESWKFSMEANNLRNGTVPWECVPFIQNYIHDDETDTSRYKSDTESALFPAVEILHSISSSETVKLNSDGKDAWIFDLDETLLSNLPYYQEHGYGSEVFNETSFYEWAAKAEAPPTETWWLYQGVLNAGFKIIILTGRDEFARDFTEQNLRNLMYLHWHKLIMRGPEDQGKDALAYKREKMAELVKEGYTLHVNVGDQWSDLLGSPPNTRNFKVPNPLYYVP